MSQYKDKHMADNVSCGEIFERKYLKIIICKGLIFKIYTGFLKLSGKNEQPN